MNHERLLTVFKTIGLALSLGASMTACGTGSVNWKEEVWLSDGKIIVVEREMIRARGGDEWASNRSGSKPKEYRLRFADPAGSGKEIEWRSTKIDSQTWPEIPLILDSELGKPIVFSSVFNVGGCNIYSKYHYQNGAWVEEKLPKEFEKRITNLLIFDDKNMQQFINLETKRKKNSDIRTQLFQQVGPTNPDCSHA
ncbi:MAG: hypothetical protein HYZ65_10615 [Burkholderiales bacterium]|nr:hypothetical protein [Burkholderiales bacterium]MBI3285282.1 hypothetical protein [Burkholderiales bacterium]